MPTDATGGLGEIDAEEFVVVGEPGGGGVAGGVFEQVMDAKGREF